MCFLQVFADFLSFVVNFWPGDDFLGGSSAETSIFPYNFLERQSFQDPYLSIRISSRVYQAYSDQNRFKILAKSRKIDPDGSKLLEIAQIVFKTALHRPNRFS